MIPPKGFKAEQYPLRHRLIYSFALSHAFESTNTAWLPIVHSSSDMDTEPAAIIVNPHNTDYVEDAGPLVRQMSILDKMRISLKFNMTAECNDLAHTSGQSTSELFTGDGIQSLHCLWRPVFGSFDEKLLAVEPDNGATVATMLGLTVDSTNEDVVPITTNKLSVLGLSDLAQPMSSVNAVQVFGDFNLTTNTTMEDHVWDEDLFQAMLRRSIVKGALRSFVGRTRHFTLSRDRPFKNFFIDKFLPRAIRRIVPFSFFGIQVHIPYTTDVEQTYEPIAPLGGAHVGVKIIANYHEWNPEHSQDMGTQV